MAKYTTRTSIFSNGALIPNCVGGAGADPPTYEEGNFCYALGS